MATAEKTFGYAAPRRGNGLSHWLALMFGCSHRHIGRPFTRNGQTFRSCIDCGARQKFDIGNWETRGGFHYSI
jgi:hypothetical protein